MNGKPSHTSHTATALAAALCLALSGGVASADAINASAFAAHFDVMFPGYSGAAPLTDFPVLVRLSPALNGFNYSLCQAGGTDLRFADAEGNLLPCEVDTWNENGESLVWVKVPSLSRATRITAYYGCANPPANMPSAVWSNGFVGVWHLGGTTLPLVESSGVSTGFNESKGGETFGASGAIGGAVDFTTGGRSGRLTAPDDDDLDGFSSFTVELWSKQAEGSSDYQPYLLTKTASGEFAYTFYQNKTTGKTNSVFYVFSDATNNGRKNIAGDSRNLVVPSMGVWNHQAIVRDIAARKSFSYLDGAAIPNGGKDLDASTEMLNVCNSSSPLYLGNATGNNPSAAFPGQIDELRISNVARSADWVKATHDCVADANFAAYGVGNDWGRYARKFTVTFPGAPAGETLSNFPVLVKVSENNPEGFSYADCRKPNGGDLRFSDASGNLLPSEVDTWNESGESLVWVKEPSLSRATKITAYYGCASAPPVDPTAVWDDDFVGVWHLGGTTLPLIESSNKSAAFDRMDGTVLFAQEGAAGGAVDFSSGTDSRLLALDDDSILAGFDDFTVELWSKQESANPSGTYQPYLLAKVISGQYAYILYQNMGTANSVFRISTDGSASANISGSAMIPTMEAWNHQVVIRNTTDTKAYCFMNGSPAPDGGVSLPSGYDAQMPNSASPLYLGNAQTTANTKAFPGQIDELRISKSARSAAWVQATYETVTSASFAQYSATRANSGVTVIYVR